MAMKIHDKQGNLAPFPQALVIVTFVISFLDMFIAAFLIWQGTLDIDYAVISLIVGLVILFVAVIAVGAAILLRRKRTTAWFVATVIPTVFLLISSSLILTDFTVLVLGA